MALTQENIDSLAAKLDALSEGEKLALQAVVAHAAQETAEVEGFQLPELPRPGLHFDKIEWVWKAPAGTEAFRAPDTGR